MPIAPLSVWILAARPKTLWAAIAPVIIGTAMALDVGTVHWLSALVALLGAVLIQTGTNFANDYMDFQKGTDTADRLGPTRATQAGLVTPRQMKIATVVTFTLAVAAGLYLVWRGGLPILVIGLLSILFGVLYTAGPYPLGYHGVADLFVLLFFGPVAVGGTYYVQALDISWIVIIAGLAPGLFSVAILTVNNLRDIESDGRSGKHTLAVRWGPTYARLQYLLAIVVACCLPTVLYLTFRTHLAVAATLVVIPIAIPAIKSVFRDTGTRLNDTLAVTGKLLLLYSVLFSMGWLL